MNAKKRILGGAILTALAGTGAYFCSNNDDKSPRPYEKTSIEQSIRAEQSEQDFLDIIAKPYRPEKDTILEDVINTREDKTKDYPPIKREKDLESLEDKFNRISTQFSKSYHSIATIQRDYESKYSEGKLIDTNGDKLVYLLEPGKIHIARLGTKNGTRFIFKYDGEKVITNKWEVFEKDKNLLEIRQNNESAVAYLRPDLYSDSISSKKIETAEEIQRFTIWDNLIRDIILLHPDYGR